MTTLFCVCAAANGTVPPSPVFCPLSLVVLEEQKTGSSLPLISVPPKLFVVVLFPGVHNSEQLLLLARPGRRAINQIERAKKLEYDQVLLLLLLICSSQTFLAVVSELIESSEQTGDRGVQSREDNHRPVTATQK